VVEFPLEEQLRRAIVNRRPGVWRVVPSGVTAYVQDRGPSAAEWEMISDRPVRSKNPHERYSQSFYGPVEDE
jgi:hypothetical protein